MSRKKPKTSKTEPNELNTELNLQKIVDLPDIERKIINWLRRRGESSLVELSDYIGLNKQETKELLLTIEEKGFLEKRIVAKELFYQVKVSSRKQNKTLWKQLDSKVGKITFSSLIILTFVTVGLLTPFAFSPLYLPNLRDNFFQTYQVLQGNLYKQISGYISLAFVFLEMILTARKRGRGWFVEVKIPGDVRMWRGLHIFLGVALLGIIVIHTVGSHGLNFNAIFLWIFFGVTLSALIGVVTETGVLESPRKYFGSPPQSKSIIPTIQKGVLIRNWREIWLSTHIFLVNVFFVMLVVHIFLAYYY